MPMLNPVHPGRILRNLCLKPFSLNITEGARVLGVSRQALSNLVNERSSLSVEMALRISKAFGSTPEMWLRIQAAYDLAQVKLRADEFQVARYEGPITLPE